MVHLWPSATTVRKLQEGPYAERIYMGRGVTRRFKMLYKPHLVWMSEEMYTLVGLAVALQRSLIKVAIGKPSSTRDLT